MSARRLGIALLIWLASLSGASLCDTLQEVHTSTRRVTGILVTADGTVTVSTRGGVLQRVKAGEWRKYTILDGLPDNEALGVYPSNDGIAVHTVRGSAHLEDGRWVTDPATNPAAPLLKGQTCSARWQGNEFAATVEGLRRRVNGSWKPLPMPRSTGTHISALLDRGAVLWAAMFGDGVYSWDGKAWASAKLAIPDRARQITAMASAGDTLWLGTSRDGVWEYDGHRWTQHLQPGEPHEHNCQALAPYQGHLYISTLEDGLVVRTDRGWQHVAPPAMSGNTPRQMVEFGGQLYVRQSTGIVDRFDGKTWSKNVTPGLPRKQCSAIAADSKRLYVGQWGGWSEFDGKTWIHHLDMPELQGCQITALLPESDRIWVGTQRLGLAEVERSTWTLKWHSELAGLPDDTVKCLARADTICAGTFSQGLAWMLPDGRWTKFPEIASAQVTDIVSDAAGGLYVGARTGLWRLTADRRIAPIVANIEVQALLSVGPDLWVGTRTGLLRCSTDTPSTLAR